MSVAGDRARTDDRPVAGVPVERARRLGEPARRRNDIDAGPAGGTSVLAPGGWLVEVRLTIDQGPGFRFFAVGISGREQAEEAILRFPGIVRDDIRKARRQLSAEEIARLQLRVHGVRPYRAGRP